MASVCTGCLSMLAAGILLKRMVAWVAMGLLLDESGGDDESTVLTDIPGSEDALGTIDFKVAGDSKGITAVESDIKCEGLSLPLMHKALDQARPGGLHILDLMKQVVPCLWRSRHPCRDSALSRCPGRESARLLAPVAPRSMPSLPNRRRHLDQYRRVSPPVVNIVSASDSVLEATFACIQDPLAPTR